MPWFKITSSVPSYAKKWGLTESDQKVVWADSEFQARRIGTSLTGVPPSAIRASNSTLPGAMIRGELGADPSNYGSTRLGPAPDRGAFSGQAQETGERASDIGALRPPDETKAHGEMIGAIDPGLAGFKDVISSMPTGLADDFNVDLSGLDTNLSRERFNPDRSGDLDAVETFESQALSEEAKAEADAIATNKLLSGPIRSWEDRVKDIKTVGPVGARTVALPPDMFRVDRSNHIKEKELQQVFKRLASLEGSDNYDQVVGSFMVRARRHYADNPPTHSQWLVKGFDDGSYRFSDEFKNLRSGVYDDTFGKREGAVSKGAGDIGDPQGFEEFDAEKEAQERADADEARAKMLAAEAAADAANAEAAAAGDTGALDADDMLTGMAGDATGPTGPTGEIDPTAPPGAAAPGIGTFGEGLGAGGAGLGVTDVTGVAGDPNQFDFAAGAMEGWQDPAPVPGAGTVGVPAFSSQDLINDPQGFLTAAGQRLALRNVFGEPATGVGPLASYLQRQTYPLSDAYRAGGFANIAREQAGEVAPQTTFEDFLTTVRDQPTGLGGAYGQALQNVDYLRGLGGSQVPTALAGVFNPEQAANTRDARALLQAAQRGKYSGLVSRSFRRPTEDDLFSDYVLARQDASTAGTAPQNFLNFAASRYGL